MTNKQCLCCGYQNLAFLFSLGSMPPVNAFVEKDETEEAFPLDLCFCENCSLIQLGEIVDPKKLFTNYHHTSSASAGNVKHLEYVVKILEAKLLVDGKKVLEIGSNDGLLLSLLKKSGAEVLGVDPAENLYQEVKAKDVSSLVGFFDENFANQMKIKYSHFDTIVALNVMAHTPTFLSALKGVRKLLSPEGSFMMENAYVVDTILEGQFDTIYHEHIFCFSLHSLMYAYEIAGLKAVDAEIIPTQGTSIRVFVQHKDTVSKPSNRMLKILENEIQSGFKSPEVFKKSSQIIEDFRIKFLCYIKKNNTSKFIALGAPARGVVILNYCKIDSKYIDLVIDDTKLKQGKYIPGLKIQVKDWSALDIKNHHQFIILSWNYAESFIARLRSLGATGKVLIPFPHFHEIIL
jgi:2-polyprenyl-3-methyl-5-hydroxy-6-metoxy-1,4-benzoquinol methylase